MLRVASAGLGDQLAHIFDQLASHFVCNEYLPSDKIILLRTQIYNYFQPMRQMAPPLLLPSLTMGQMAPALLPTCLPIRQMAPPVLPHSLPIRQKASPLLLVSLTTRYTIVGQNKRKHIFLAISAAMHNLAMRHCIINCF